MVKLLLAKDGVDPDSKDSDYGRTPLSWAAGSGHEAVVRLLLAKDGVDPDSKDDNWVGRRCRGRQRTGTRRWSSCCSRRTASTRTPRIAIGRTPLSWAAENGHEAVVKLLLAKDGVDPDSRIGLVGRRLSWAAENGHEAVVKLLHDLI